MSDVPVGRTRRYSLWWVYFGYYALAFVWGTYGQLTSSPIQFFTIMSVLFDGVGLCGLYCFLRSTPLASRPFWMVFTVLFFCRLCVGLYLFTRILVVFHWQGGREDYVTFLGVVGMFLGLPALVAFWLYTFRSQEIWGQAQEVSKAHG